ncbi:MAG: response regulator [Candidatus Rokubacteria bacterium]|nr:response regulator [Candidatus Rokubacteria bacterium]
MAKVLIVDDSLSVRKMVERAFGLKGFEVLSASSGAEAMERIGSAMPDVVVCDIVMPDGDGYRICEFVRAHPTLSETPVLLISGFINSAVLDRAAQVRPSDVLRKPFTADDLARKVDELLAARSRRAAAPVGLPAAAADEMVALSDLKAILVRLASMPGVRLAALVDREGFVIETAGEIGVGAEVAGALAAWLAEASEGLGREMGQGALSSMVLDYEAGMVLLHGAGPSAILAVVLSDPHVLGKVRHYVKRVLLELLRSI